MVLIPLSQGFAVKVSARVIIYKIFYSISANFFSLLVSLIVSFLVPKVLGVEQYGYWQLYTFYVSYVGFFHFGIADGLYLRYGGKYYDELDKPLMHSQFWLVASLEIIIFFGISLFTLLWGEDENKIFILVASGLNCFLILPRTVLQYLLQSTGRVKEFARNTIIERLLYVILVLSFFFLVNLKFEYMVLADIIAKSVALIEMSLVCKDIVFTHGVKIPIMFKEVWENISTGIKLLFANIAGMLIIGIVRFCIERTWNISTFGKVSFSLSISNFILTFIAALGIVIFPIIKRSDEEKRPQVYKALSALLSDFLYLSLIFYYPSKHLLLWWLPQYGEAVNYLSILFPISIFAAKNDLLINTYLKALREENMMLVLNIIAVLLSSIVTVIVVLWMKNLNLTILSIVCLYYIKYFLPDRYLQRVMRIKYSYDAIWDLVATIAFILCSWCIGNLTGWLLYIGFIFVVLLIRSKTNIEHMHFVKAIIY